MPGFPRGILAIDIDQEKHVCSQCELILNDPAQSSCGHRFCKDCLQSLIRSTRPESCPRCLREDISEIEARITDDTIVPDFALKRDLKLIPVKCVNNGCTWKGKFSDYEKHQENCAYKSRLCMHAGCGKYVQTASYKFHTEKECPFRPMYCKRCGDAVPYKYLKKHNSSECSKSEIDCEYCGKKVFRGDLSSHHDNETGDCLRSKSNSCVFEQFGCKTKVSLYTVDKHLQENFVNHLYLLCTAFIPIFKYYKSNVQVKEQAEPTNVDEGKSIEQSEENEYKEKTTQSNEQSEKQSKGKSTAESNVKSNDVTFEQLTALTTENLSLTPVDLKSSEVKEFISNLVKTFLDAHIKSGFKLEAREHLKEDKDDKLRVDVDASATSSVESLTADIAKMDVSIEKLIAKQARRIQKIEHDLQILSSNGKTYQEAMQVLGDQAEVTNSQLTKLQEKMKVLEDDFGRSLKSVTTEIATLQSMMQDLQGRITENEEATHNGVIIWKITDYARKRRESIQQGTSLYSPIFYSAPHGYKMRCRLFLNGDGVGKGSHFSIFFMLLRGKYDATLPWPFKYVVKFMLIDQNNFEHIIDGFKPEPSSSSFQRPKSERNIPTGCPLFITPQEVEKSRNAYIKDDCIFIRVSVEPK